MPGKPSKPFGDHNPLAEVARAYGRALWSRGALPPGDLVDLLELERRNRTALIELASRHGPVFKGMMHRQLAICVVGHSLGRRLLKDHARSMRPLTIELESLFPIGFMRGMQGNIHRHYRSLLVRAIAATDVHGHARAFQHIASSILDAYAADPGQGASPHAWADALGCITLSALIEYLFGVAYGSEAHERLVAGYRALGPHGVVWNITERQVEAFGRLRSEIQNLPRHPGNVFGSIAAIGAVDETMLGNLIYMVELGRYDTRGLLRWISRYAADNPDWVERIVAKSANGDGVVAAEAFVLETLRMDQSERLMRNVKRDIRFEGWLIPAGALVRICMWEAHKDPEAFARPFVFDPDRFLEVSSAGERFSPFGLDHHLCPLSELTIAISVAFLRALTERYRVRGKAAEPATRGPYHWEPSPSFVVRLEPRAHPITSGRRSDE